MTTPTPENPGLTLADIVQNILVPAIQAQTAAMAGLTQEMGKLTEALARKPESSSATETSTPAVSLQFQT